MRSEGYSTCSVCLSVCVCVCVCVRVCVCVSVTQHLTLHVIICVTNNSNLPMVLCVHSHLVMGNINKL